MKKNLTMQDIARISGVSITTVSHVINKTRHVNQETRDAVLSVIRSANYKTPKRQSNNKKKHKYIGVIIADLREDFFVSVLKSIETTAFDQGVSIIFCDSEGDTEKEARNILTLLERNIDGLILAPIESKDTPEILTKTQVPIVLLDRQYENHDFLFIGINNFKSALEGTDFLYNKGATRIGFIGYDNSVYTIKQRILGYSAYLAEKQEKTCLLLLNHEEEDFFPLIKDYIHNNKIDAIFCATSTLCYEVIAVLSSLPEEEQKGIKVISYVDNKWLDFLKIPISVIAQPTAEIGSAAIETLIQMITNKNQLPNVKRELLFEANIIDKVD